jgi:hypothetical protein
MLAAITINMNRRESDEPVSHHSFLPFPAAAVKVIQGMSPLSLAISTKIVPSQSLAPILVPMREQLISSYYWASDRWLYE